MTHLATQRNSVPKEEGRKEESKQASKKYKKIYNLQQSEMKVDWKQKTKKRRKLWCHIITYERKSNWRKEKRQSAPEGVCVGPTRRITNKTWCSYVIAWIEVVIYFYGHIMNSLTSFLLSFAQI